VFQSSPHPKAGRNSTYQPGLSPPRRCFNPRPTRRQGATWFDRDADLRLPVVSILAPPEGRAQRTPPSSDRPADPSFNPRPTRRQGAT